MPSLQQAVVLTNIKEGNMKNLFFVIVLLSVAQGAFAADKIPADYQGVWMRTAIVGNDDAYQPVKPEFIGQAFADKFVTQYGTVLLVKTVDIRRWEDEWGHARRRYTNITFENGKCFEIETNEKNLYEHSIYLYPNCPDVRGYSFLYFHVIKEPSR